MVHISALLAIKVYGDNVGTRPVPYSDCSHAETLGKKGQIKTGVHSKHGTTWPLHAAVHLSSGVLHTALAEAQKYCEGFNAKVSHRICGFSIMLNEVSWCTHLVGLEDGAPIYKNHKESHQSIEGRQRPHQQGKECKDGRGLELAWSVLIACLHAKGAQCRWLVQGELNRRQEVECVYMYQVATESWQFTSAMGSDDTAA